MDAGTWYADADGDGFGDPDAAIVACEPEVGYVADASDCDDGNEDIHPDADEHCDDVDEDCNGIVDDNPVDGEPYYADVDGDGYGDPESVVWCVAPEGYVDNADDCNDGDDAVHPEATDICNDVDDDCDAEFDEDALPNLGAWTGGVLYADIQQAVDAAPSGGLVAVCPGVYDVELMIDDDVVVRSTTRDAATTTFDGGDAHTLMFISDSTVHRRQPHPPPRLQHVRRRRDQCVGVTAGRRQL